MPTYVRAFHPGGTFFLTLVTDRRAPIFANESFRSMLHSTIDRCRKLHPFIMNAVVLLPDHLHMLITLPDGDADFSTRLANIKAGFTRRYVAASGAEQDRSDSRIRQRVRGVWLKRFWEHAIRDADDLRNHFDYIHFNPVKHAYAKCPHGWPHSSFHRFVSEDRYARNWCCQCEGSIDPPVAFDEIAAFAGE
jgi:REP-associated tyrosine transposase